MKRQEHRGLVALAAWLAAAALVACGGPGAVITPGAPDPVVGSATDTATLSGQERARTGPTEGVPAEPEPVERDADLTLDALNAALTEAILSEYFAQTTYERVLSDFGPVTPFSNVAVAEATHVDALATLFTKRALSVPPNPYVLDKQPRFADLVDACKSAVATEEGIYRTYTGLATIKGLPDDVANVFAQMMDVTLERHLPAFQQCAAS